MSDWHQIEQAAIDHIPDIMGLSGLTRVGPNRWHGGYTLDRQPHTRKDKMDVSLLNKGIKVLEQGAGTMSLVEWLHQHGPCTDWKAARDHIRATVGTPYEGTGKAFPKPMQPARTMRPPPKADPKATAQSRDAFLSVWNEATPIKLGTPQAKYLTGARCISPAIWGSADSIRAMKNQPHIIFAFSDAQGVPASGQVIHLTDAGEKIDKKFITGNSHKKAGALGGAVRLFTPYDKSLVVCEGLENALSVQTMLGLAPYPSTPDTLLLDPCQLALHNKGKRTWQELGTIPDLAQWGLVDNQETSPELVAALKGAGVWSVMGASTLKSFIPPQGVSTVFIAYDNDGKGTKNIGKSSALEAAARLGAQGYKCHLFTPDPNMAADCNKASPDFNDILINLHTKAL